MKPFDCGLCLNLERKWTRTEVSSFLSRRISIINTVKDFYPVLTLKCSRWTLFLTYYNYRWWDYGQVLWGCNDPVVGELFFGDHVGGGQDGLCRHQDEAAQQEEALHLSLQTNTHGQDRTHRDWTVIGPEPSVHLFGIDHFSLLVAHFSDPITPQDLPDVHWQVKEASLINRRHSLLFITAVVRVRCLLSVYRSHFCWGHLQRIRVANSVNSGVHRPLQWVLICECCAIVLCH